uniref:Uncharacterized protein n=1 Tax=Arundo donax TaxID=35708 RepID=A0A0A9HRV2_ARUDO
MKKVLSFLYVIYAGLKFPRNVSNISQVDN